MKKVMIPVIALVAASVAVPALAQSRGYDRDHDRGPRYEQNYGGWQSITQRKFELDRRIDRGLRNRQLSWREANSLKAQLNDLVRLERQYMRNGLSRWERQDLDRRYDRLERMIRFERRDDNNRPGRGNRH